MSEADKFIKHLRYLLDLSDKTMKSLSIQESDLELLNKEIRTTKTLFEVARYPEMQKVCEIELEKKSEKAIGILTWIIFFNWKIWAVLLGGNKKKHYERQEKVAAVRNSLSHILFVYAGG